MKRSVAVLDFSRAGDRPGSPGQAVVAEEFLTKAACAALTGLLANPVAHEEHIRWDDLSREAWDIAEEMLKGAPDGLLTSKSE